MKGHHASDLNAPPEAPSYRMEMQKKGGSFGVVTATNPVPMKATPVTKRQTGLGAADCSHPYLKGKPQI